MTGVVDIYNIALSEIRAGRVDSVNEQSAQARQCSLYYDILRKQVLRDAPWGFARTIQALALLDSDTYSVFNWAYVYQYPSDCLRINRLILNHEFVQSGTSTAVTSRFYDRNLPIPDHKTPVPYEVLQEQNTKVIVANDSNLRLDYNIDNGFTRDPTNFDSAFILALGNLLGAHVAVSLVGEEKGSGLKKDLLAVYNKYISNAIANNANERYETPADSESITVRS